MAASTVIREFLVNLGFRVDQTALQNFTSGISRATKSVLVLGGAVEAMASTIAIGVQRFASNLEQLYFASQRTGSSATALIAFDRTLQNFGASAGEGLASIEALAHAVRTNPGNEGLLAGLGVQIKHLKDGSIDAQNAMMQLAPILAKQPFYLANQYAQALGISEKTLIGMRNGDFAKEFARVGAEVKNQGLDKAAEDAHKFMMNLRDLLILLQAFGLQVYDILSKRLGVTMEGFTKWLQVHGPALAQRVATALEMLLDLAEKIIPVIAWLMRTFIQLDTATGGLSTKLIAAIALLKIFGGFEIITGVLQLARAFTTLALSIGQGMASGVGLMGVLGKIGAVGAAGAAGWGLGTLAYDAMSVGAQNSIGEMITRLMAIAGSKSANETLALQNPIQYLMDQSRGRITREQAIGLIANFKRESSLNPNAQQKGGEGYGLGQWSKERQADFARVAGHDIHGSSSAEQYNFALYELLQGKEQYAGRLLQGQHNAAMAARVVAMQYERHGAGDAETEARERLAAQIDQTTTINVYGVKDPQAAAKAAADHQDGINQRMARNFNAVN